MLSHLPLEIGNDRLMQAERELGIRTHLDTLKPKRVESARLITRQRLLDAHESRPPPQVERSGQDLGRARRRRVRNRAPLGRKPFEGVCVELDVRSELHDVATGP